MSVQDKLKAAQKIFAIIMFVRGIFKNKDLLAAVEVILENLEDVFEEVPGEFPDNIIDMLQDLLGFDDKSILLTMDEAFGDDEDEEEEKD